MTLNEFIKSLEIPTKIAITMVLLGGAALFLIDHEWKPLASGDVITTPLAAACLLIGACVLVVNAGYETVAMAKVRMQKTNDAKAAEDKRLKDQEEVKKNLLAMTDLEAKQLLWILRNCGDRFDLKLEYGLVQKRIVVPVDRTGSLYELHEIVSSQKATMLGASKDTSSPGEFPMRGWMGV